MSFPHNEKETIELYKILEDRIGWQIVHLQTAYPDAIIAKNHHQLNAEFEFEARNFELHGHPPDGCDLIICWRNNWPDAPLPVLALNRIAQKEAEVVFGMVEEPRNQNRMLHGEMAVLKYAPRCALLENQVLRERLGMIVYEMEDELKENSPFFVLRDKF